MFITAIQNKNITTNLILSQDKMQLNKINILTEKSSDTFQKSKITFKGYIGVDGYGTPEIKEALSYKIQLTPQKIDTIIENSKTTDEGILLAYNELSEESKHLNKAFNGFKFINTQYKTVAKEKLRQVIQEKPIGSNVPLVRQVTLPISVSIGSFEKKLVNQINSILGDFHEIHDKYIHEGLCPMINDYLNVNKYMQEGIEYVNTIKGDSPVRTKVLENTVKYFEGYYNLYNHLDTGLDNQIEQLFDAGEGIVKNQVGRQQKKVDKMAIRKLLIIILSGS